MPEFTKLDPGDIGYLVDWPQKCICGSQKGPMIATGITYRVAPGIGAETAGHIYLCRLCVTRAARGFGMVKGDEYERLQNAADELAEASRQVADRDAIIAKQNATNAEQAAKIRTQQEYIESLQGEKRLMVTLAGQLQTTAKELAGV